LKRALLPPEELFVAPLLTGLATYDGLPQVAAALAGLNFVLTKPPIAQPA
jgi:hypothetical protein